MERWGIVERTYYAVEVSLESPLCVSGGTSEVSDSDVLRNGNGELFVPGTSVAGAFRNYLMLDKKQSGMMGNANGEDGKMSSLYISDLYIKNGVTSVRDFVALSDEKHVSNKFDTEIVETGAKGILYFHYVKRENTGDDYKEMISRVLQGIQAGHIRFGAKKNRGFGRMRIGNIYVQSFSKENAEAWIGFSEKELSHYQNVKSFEEWKKTQKVPEDVSYVKLIVPLELTGGISIRKYSTRPEEADYEQLTCNDVPVIPGSSWCGAIRAGARSILEELWDKDVAAEYIDEWFGRVKTAGAGIKDAWQSKVVVAESVIEGGNSMVVTRNKINRFDASTKRGALYTERSHFGGTTRLELVVKKDAEGEYKSMCGLLQLIAGEIGRGELPIGGLVSVGRGIFCENGTLRYEGAEQEEVSEWNKALAKKVRELSAVGKEEA